MRQDADLRWALIAGARGNLGSALRAEAARRNWAAVGMGRGCGAYGIDVDLADYRALEQAVQRLSGRFHLIVMAQGYQAPTLLNQASPDRIERIFRDNLLSATYLSSLLLREGKLAEGGLIVYCSSIQAAAPRPGRALYAAAKSGLEGLMRGVAAELWPKGRAIALRLGQFTTPMSGLHFPPEEEAYLKSRSPLGFLEPPSIASLVFALFEAKQLTGCVIDYEGGQLRNIW